MNPAQGKGGRIEYVANGAEQENRRTLVTTGCLSRGFTSLGGVSRAAVAGAAGFVPHNTRLRRQEQYSESNGVLVALLSVALGCFR